MPPDIELNTAASSENDFGSINFWGELGYGSDPESCLEAWTEERREFFEGGGSGQGISPFAEVERNTDPLRLANVADGDGADVTVYLDFGEGKPKYIVTYACLPLITGEAVLKVSTSAFVSEHEGVLRSAREVLATLQLPSIAGNAYTSPTWGYSLSWDANQWEADIAAEINDAGEDRLDRIVFENGTSTLTIEGSAKYEGDVAACLQRESDALAMTDGVSDFAPAAASGQTIGGQDEASAYGVYTFRLEAGTSRPIN